MCRPDGNAVPPLHTVDVSDGQLWVVHGRGCYRPDGRLVCEVHRVMVDRGLVHVQGRPASAPEPAGA